MGDQWFDLLQAHGIPKSRKCSEQSYLLSLFHCESLSIQVGPRRPEGQMKLGPSCLDTNCVFYIYFTDVYINGYKCTGGEITCVSLSVKLELVGHGSRVSILLITTRSRYFQILSYMLQIKSVCQKLIKQAYAWVIQTNSAKGLI